jgi:hypothetical protein
MYALELCHIRVSYLQFVQQYRVEISYRLAALENLDAEVGINSAC